jgi:hypothetical protein
MKLIIIPFIIGLIFGIRFEKETKSNTREYLDSPDKYLSGNSNKENFIAMFSNLTKLDGAKLYSNYIDFTHNKGQQFIIDKINHLNSKNIEKWAYDTNLNKFRLSEESNIIKYSKCIFRFL